MRRAAAVLVAALMATSADAYTASWQWLRGPAAEEAGQSTRRQTSPGRTEDAAACLREILDAQDRYGIPNNLLLAIGLQETGQQREDGAIVPWPWSANAAGEGRWFEDRTSAQKWVRSRLASGVDSIDVGCMQINLRWHPEAFNSLEEGFDAASNVDYAARLLSQLYRQLGDWRLAAGSYHSFTPEYRDRYLASLDQKISRANAGITTYRRIASAAPQKYRQQSPTRHAQTRPPRPAGGPIWGAALSDTSGSAGSLFGHDPIRPLFENER